MSCYEKFAQVYDQFMNNIPYDDWIEYVIKIFEKHNLPKTTGIICELGCGTGNMTTRLCEKGFDMIGIDISEQMLMEARKKSSDNILYLEQDMTEFELYGTVDAIVSFCDSINYITEDHDLLQVFKLVNNYLDINGLFVFDMNTIYKFENILSDNSFSQTTENSAYTWENYYDKEERINEFYTNFFIKDEDTSQYERYEEYHYERGYTIDEIKNMLESAGMEFVACYDELTFNPPTNESQKVFFIAREKGKEIQK